MLFRYKYYSFTKAISKLYSVRNNCTKIPVYLPNTTILGIETSCDDTGVAVVDGMGNILGEALYSQNIIHLRFGGVNPLVAHQLHRQNIELAVSESMAKANLDIKDIDAIAVTTKPGLLISLQVGVKYAKFLARTYCKPLIPIHHMEAHALVARMYHNLPLPFLVLLISGGHCLLSVVKDVDDFILLGDCLDNAPGEVLDKVARRMKLRNIPEYSKVAGGKAVELAAKKATNFELFKFPLPLKKYRDCNFSFSGLKESLLQKLVQKETEHRIMGDEIIPEVNDLCAAFQLAIAEHLANRTERAILFCEMNNLIPNINKNIVVSGGVACNDFIFKAIQVIGDKMDYKVFRPPARVCTDNGVMIAWNGIEKLKKQLDINHNISLKDVDPQAPLGTNLINEVKAANLRVRVTRLKNIFTIGSFGYYFYPSYVTTYSQQATLMKCLSLKCNQIIVLID